MLQSLASRLVSPIKHSPLVRLLWALSTTRTTATSQPLGLWHIRVVLENLPVVPDRLHCCQRIFREFSMWPDCFRRKSFHRCHTFPLCSMWKYQCHHMWTEFREQVNETKNQSETQSCSMEISLKQLLWLNNCHRNLIKNYQEEKIFIVPLDLM